MADSEKRPNFLVFFTDQQRWDTVGAYGCPMDLTPNLNAMAADGVRYEHAFSPQPVCGPARSCILTGLYATQTGVFRNYAPFDAGCETFPRLLGRAGYDLGYIGKWHLALTRTEPVPRERRYGWDGLWEAADALEHTSHPYEGTVFDADDRPLRFDGTYRTDFLTERAKAFLGRRRSAPFCLMVSYLEPHHQNDWNRFVAPDGEAEAIRRDPRGLWIPEDLRRQPGDWGAEWPDYLGMVRRLDENLGQLLRELERLGLRDNTVVLFFSDHGCHFHTRCAEYKRSAHDASIRIPFVVGGPGFRGGRVEQRPVSLIDVAPTLLDAAGLSVPPQMRGRSLCGAAEGDGSRDILVQISESMVARAVRTPRWTYCVYAPDANPGADLRSDTYVEYQLYDNAADPHQLVNLAGRPRFREVADDLRGRLLRLLAAAGEPEPAILPARFYA